MKISIKSQKQISQNPRGQKTQRWRKTLFRSYALLYPIPLLLKISLVTEHFLCICFDIKKACGVDLSKEELTQVTTMTHGDRCSHFYHSEHLPRLSEVKLNIFIYII